MSETTLNNVVQTTTDYDKFVILNANRKLRPQHVSDLVKSMSEHPELVTTRPIMVNERMEIIDGQHRFAACQTLGIPVHYIVSDGTSMTDAQLMNAIQKSWGLDDYAHSYAESGNKHYKKILEVRQEKFLPITAVIAFYAPSKNASGSMITRFKKGLYEIQDEQHGDELVEMFEMFEEFLPQHWREQRLAKAFLTMTKNPEYDHDRLINKMRSRGHIERQGGAKEYLKYFEEIYNYNTAYGNHVRFL